MKMLQVWSFTTMEDQSVRDFPYTMGFEGNNGEIPPMGGKNDHERQRYSDVEI